MPYTPVSFVDGTTPLNAANLNQVEDGVEAAERTENKGQPGGYPALDADGKVPSAQLPATGGSAALGEFQFSTTITEPPASGRIRMNNADQALATLLWISDTTSGAVAVGSLLGSIVVGEQIYIQDKNDAALYRLYDVTALPVAKTGYHEIAVTFNKGAGAAFANNETLFCTIQRLAGGGADLDYEGDYVAATEYQDGDVVVKDGIAYLCVGGPTTVAPDIAPWGAGGQPLPPVVNGQWLKGVGGAAVWSPIAVADVSGAQATAEKGAANGYASLDANSRVPNAQLPGWAQYIPTWSAAGGNIGNGGVDGYYIQIGRFVHAKIRFLGGSTTNFGTGQWSLSLPIPRAGTGATIEVGYGWAVKQGVGYYQVIGIAQTTTVVNLHSFGNPMPSWTGTAPFTWAGGDDLHFQITYEVA